MVCTFFGHAHAPSCIENELHKVLLDCIVNKKADAFYVGNQGAFDAMVRKQLQELQKEYNIRYSVVLAYRPVRTNEYEDYTDTIFPEELAFVHPRYAIAKRNEWMLKRSDCVITYVTATIGGAAKYKALAEKKKKVVINLAEKVLSQKR